MALEDGGRFGKDQRWDTFVDWPVDSCHRPSRWM
jgi:hypothetical protein